MKVLYIGDIMGRPGREVVAQVLPKVRKKHQPDLVIAQAENVSHGKSMTPGHMRELQSLGIDFFTGGNHTPTREPLHALLEDDNEPVVGPANQQNCPGKGWKIVSVGKRKVLVASILGSVIDERVITTNPLEKIDEILHETRNLKLSAKIINFHGDYSSEKRVVGYYLDGHVSAVIGDHWHVPSADAMVLPRGTAHVTDVGMCGTLHSSLGVKSEVIIERWKSSAPSRNEIETAGPRQFNAVLIDIISSTKARSIERIQTVVD